MKMLIYDLSQFLVEHHVTSYCSKSSPFLSGWKGISTCPSLKDRGGAISAAKGGSKGSKSRKSVPYPPEKDGVFAGMGFTKWIEISHKEQFEN